MLPGSAGEHLLQERLQYRCQAATRARRFYHDQVLGYLNERMQEFLATAEAMFLATADANGLPDCSPRFGPPGFVHVLSPWMAAWPEYRGNGVMASAGNILENPKAAIVAMDFTGTRMGLHVAGDAEVITDAAARMAFPALLPAPRQPRPARRALGHPARHRGVRAVQETRAAVRGHAHGPGLGKRPRRPEGRGLLRRGRRAPRGRTIARTATVRSRAPRRAEPVP